MNESWYTRYLLPYLLNFVCGLKPIRLQREKIVPLATGKVLEIGIGTGLNIPHYNKSKVEKIVGLDPALQMHHLAHKRIQQAGLQVELVGLSAETVPFPNASFDSIVVTYTLCTIPDPSTTLKEMRRLLVPGGKLLFCEHGLAPKERIQKWQNWLQPYWKKIAGGCHLNRDIPTLLKEAGFNCTDLQAGYLPGPKLLSYN